MTDRNETLSAFMDSELNKAESNEQINEVSNDVNSAYRMRRYQMIGDAMRGDLGETVNLDFAASVSAKIAQLEPLSKPTTQVAAPAVASVSFFDRWLKPASGLAIAASVALVAVISLDGVVTPEGINADLTQRAEQVAEIKQDPNVNQQVNRLAQLPISTNVLSVSTPVLNQSQSGNLQWNAINAQAVSQAKLNSYLVTHTEHSSSMQGMIPQARVAAFDVKP